ncbi:MAG: DUF2244 domain-containing protein [Methylocystis sp.]|nr:DUF2244 domain-containing protein [Methylocystis sp.]
MTAAAPLEEHILTRRLVPYRSLTPHAFHCFIVIFGLITFLFSLPFFFIGAWPVAGFMGLDVLGLYIAFRANFRSARAYETLDLTPLELVFAKVGARGQRAEWRFNPSWVRLEQKTHAEFGTERVALISRGQSVEVGSFLGPDQKAELARDLTHALAYARRGARFA